MERKNKIIIAVLVIIIIALAIGVAYSIFNNSLLKSNSVPDGMKKYDFNSEFKMAVPENTRFLKEWNNTNLLNLVNAYSYFDKNNEFSVVYADSPLVTHEFLNEVIDEGNRSGNATVTVEGDLIIAHSLKNNGKVGNTLEKSNFTETIMIQKGHMVVVINGNDLDLIKQMANTIEFYG